MGEIVKVGGRKSSGKWKRMSDSQKKAYREKRNARVRQYAEIIGKMDAVQRAELLNRIGRVVTIEGRGLSDYNTLMLFYQRKGVGMLSVVGGFAQWKNAGRRVRKGEKGLMMLYPIVRDVKDSNGGIVIEARTGEKVTRTFFGVATVFDISQTQSIAEPDAGPAALPDNSDLIEMDECDADGVFRFNGEDK